MHADQSNSHAAPAPAKRGGGMGRVLSSAAATLALGGATAVSADPALAGAAAVFADAPAWLTPALAGATALAGLRLLFAMKPARRPAPATVARDERVEESETPAPAVAEEDEVAAESPRRAVSDPSAVFPVYSAAAPAAETAYKEEDEELAGDADVLPFPSADPAAETGWEYDADEPRVAAADGDAPATIRFEDVPSSITVGSRTVDLTEAADADHRHDALKGLTKKEKRTVRNALRDRERLLRRAA